MAARGRDVAGHRSRAAGPGDLAGADLILGMAREHVRQAVVLLPAAWPRAFTLREFLRRGHEIGARAPGEPLANWLAQAASGRDRRDLLGVGPSDEDVADPVGGPLRAYRASADLLDRLTADLADLCWRDGTGR
jgi:protein-tyrosine phosphatase